MVHVGKTIEIHRIWGMNRFWVGRCPRELVLPLVTTDVLLLRPLRLITNRLEHI